MSSNRRRFPGQRSICSVLVLSAWLTGSGCGSSTPTGEVVPTVAAAGTVTHDGRPLGYYQITLVPPNKGRPAVGTSDADGKFVLGTNRPGDGAIAGTHAVAIQFVGPPSTNPEEGMTVFTPLPPPPIKLDKRFGDATKSGLTIEIPSGGNRELSLVIP